MLIMTMKQKRKDEGEIDNMKIVVLSVMVPCRNCYIYLVS